MDRLRSRQDERGIALILTLIFSILLYILVAELVVSGRMLKHTGENDALVSRMQNQMEYTLNEVYETLLSDLASQAAGAESGGGSLAGALGNTPGGTGANAGGGGKAGGGDAAAGGAGGDDQADPSASCDSSRDSWAKPQSRAENDLTTYYLVEAENSKLNLLALWSPDEKFAQQAKEQVVRLIDTLREDSDYDVSSGDAERIVQEIMDWARRSGTDSIPKPPLKSDEEKERELSLPTHLDELLLLPSVSEDLFFDKVIDGKVYRGLESVLTVWTSLQMDPGDPEKLARNAARQGQNGAPAANGQGGNAQGGTPQGGNAPNGAAPASGAQGANAGAAAGAKDPNAPPPQPIGEGIRININFASRPVLRALYPQGRVPDEVIDAIIKWRNEEDPDEKEKDAAATTQVSDFGDLKLGDDTKKRFFATVADLEKVQEFANLPDPELKAEFQTMCTTKSEVFSIHLATLFRRNEETRSYVMRRARAVVVRRDDGDKGVLYPIVRLEERHGLRVVAPDMQDEHQDLSMLYSNMDSFAQEDRAWNPFLVDFYLPKWQRDQFLRR